VNIDDLIKSAIQHHQTGNLQQAENIYREILNLQPDNFNALHYIGVLYYQSGNYEFAVEYRDLFNRCVKDI
jgi:tetratricopeptide (TPR) repeat protein